MSKKYKGVLVTFEGIDQSGKSTQVTRLEQKLTAEKIEPLVLREPGSTRISEQVRRILLSTENGEMDARTELLLYCAARAQLVAEALRPALDKGRFVIIDRYYHSTTAYQGYGRKLSLDLIETINSAIIRNCEPDLTFIVDIPPDIALHRKDEAGRDRVEQSALEFYDNVRKGYLEMAKGNDKMYILDGRSFVEVLEKEIWRKVRETLLKR